MDEVRGHASGRIKRRVPRVIFGLLAVMVVFGSVPSASASHKFAGGNEHTVVATDCSNPGCANPPDLLGGSHSGSYGRFTADGGSTVVSEVELAMAEGPTCTAGTVCTAPTPGQTAIYEIRSASSISNCDTTTNSVVESGGNLGRNFVATWTVPTTTGNYHACVALAGATSAFGGTYVEFAVF